MSMPDPNAVATGYDAESLQLPTGWGVPWSLIVLAAPIIASMISRTLMSFADFYMVSYLGTEAQAAIMPAVAVLFVVLGFGMGLLSAVQTYVSQSFGRHDRHACAAYAWQGLYLCAMMALVCLPLIPFVGPFFAWVGHAPEVQRMETIYVQIGIVGLFPALAAMSLSNFAQGIHKPAIGLWSMIAANLFNILANFALIFGMWGFPRLGIAGAAIATQISGLLQAAIVLMWMLAPVIARHFPTRDAWRPDWPRLRQLIWIGLPAGVQLVVDIFAITVFTLFLVGRFGTVQLAAHNIAFKLLELSFMPVIGLGAALTVAVGKAIGHKRPDHARLLTKWCMAFGVAWMGSIGVLYFVAGHDLASLMIHDDEHRHSVAEWAAWLLIFCAVFQVFDALNITHVSALRGAGDNHWPAVASATLAGLVMIGGGYLIAWAYPQWGATGPWIAATVYICLYGLTMTARWVFGPWERLDMFRTAESP